MKQKTHIIWAVVAVAALVAGIFWGRAMAGGAPGNSRFGALSSSSRTFAGRGNSSANVFAGQVSAIDGSSITLQLPSGNSEVVLYASSTPVTEPTNVSIAKVVAGTNIMVMGTQNSDGSVTAQSIEIRNGFGPFGGGRQGSSTPAGQ